MDGQERGAAPLAGRRILDLSRVLAGPWATMVLADLGADVIKVENPRGGDDTRHWGPPYTGGESAYYLCANRNKRSIAIDLASADGQRIVRELAARADVLVENYKQGGLARFGLDYESLAILNPRLVYCSISGYGRASPLADRAGYDYVVQAEAGLMAVTGPVDGEPMKVGVAVADLFTGMAAAQAILAALIAADRDGQGQHLDMALYDCQLAMLANVGSAALVSGREPRRWGNGHPTIVPYQLFDTSDGQVVIAVGNDGQFAALCNRLLDRPDLCADERFATNRARVQHRDDLLAELVPLIAAQSTDWWLGGLQAIGVPSGKVRGVREALDAAETLARGMVETVAHPTAGSVDLVASPLKLSRTPVRPAAAPPLHGADADAILGELGYGISSIAELRGSGAIG
ncbi:CoA transferase [Sphingomonas ginkgonis]|uniref:CoA transferase n=1 Tax=Sphingomonas ginkgonis TaxID=2315330 RepID=A0A3R9YMY7_9SPHN|nr:CaiB/BaiF CoA-transferase family protein [Sphingomonas ginkgonis]RST31193.1 CoA transferase [Sphingomonas ginkgonis]